MENKNVLITGGNGFIGSHVTNKLVDLGYNVYVLCRRENSHNPLFNQNLENKKIKIFKGNIDDFDFSVLPKNINYIIHIAGLVSVYGKMKDFMKVNFEGTKRLLEFSKTLPQLQCFTYISTTAVYGYTGYVGRKEEDIKKPFNNPYSISKLKTEEYVKEFSKTNNQNYLIIRPANVFGEYDYTSSHEIYSRVKKQKMSICAGGKYKSCFVYSGNLANAIIHTTLNSNTYNTDYNVSDGQNETLKEYLTIVAKKFGVKPKFINFPAPISKIVATLVEGIYKLFRIKKAPLITRFSIYQNCCDYNFSIEKLLSTGYKIETDFETAIENTVNWYNSIDKKEIK